MPAYYREKQFSIAYSVIAYSVLALALFEFFPVVENSFGGDRPADEKSACLPALTVETLPVEIAHLGGLEASDLFWLRQYYREGDEPLSLLVRLALREVFVVHRDEMVLKPQLRSLLNLVNDGLIDPLSSPFLIPYRSNLVHYTKQAEIFKRMDREARLRSTYTENTEPYLFHNEPLPGVLWSESSWRDWARHGSFRQRMGNWIKKWRRHSATRVGSVVESKTADEGYASRLHFIQKMAVVPQRDRFDTVKRLKLTFPPLTLLEVASILQLFPMNQQPKVWQEILGAPPLLSDPPMYVLRVLVEMMDPLHPELQKTLLADLSLVRGIFILL